MILSVFALIIIFGAIICTTEFTGARNERNSTPEEIAAQEEFSRKLTTAQQEFDKKVNAAASEAEVKSAKDMDTNAADYN